MDPWIIAPVERARHIEQFKALNPVAGFIVGDQAKGFLLQSQLPPIVLGQIWSLADANCDGKMDINEFSVACKLITMKLKGFEVPQGLPPALRMVLAGTGHSTPSMSPSGSLTGIAPAGMVPTALSQAGVASQPMMMAQQIPASMGMGMPQQVPGTMGMSMPSQIPGTMVMTMTMPQQVPASMGMGMPQQVPASMGMGMPQQVPISMGMQQQVPMGGVFPQQVMMPPTSLQFAQQQQPVMRSSQSQSSVQQLSRSGSITSQDIISPTLMEWSIPHPSRLKYTQAFNQNDRTKSGFLSGVQARNILMGTGLPQQILATVWALSDLDSDGRLSCEEFILSMHLCDVFRQTGRLPPKLPADLIPPSYRSGSRRMSVKSASGPISGHNTGSNTPTTLDEPLLSPGGTSFEDKRKQNYDKGQAELDRRRKVLEDIANREREERDRKEREEFEKREKQRLEAERRKQEEMERQMAAQREMEERRMEEMRKAEEQKEAARKEMDRQRKAEMEENKRNELLARRQKEQDEVLRLKGVNHGLGLEISQLTDKVKELSNKITETRTGVSTVKSEIDGMRSKRDTYMNDMAMLKAQLKDQNQRLVNVAQERIRVEKWSAESEVKKMNVKQLKDKQTGLKEEFEKKEADTNTAKVELDELKSQLSTLVDGCRKIYEEYREKREQIVVMRKKHSAEFNVNAAWGAVSPREPEPEAIPEEPNADGGAVYYRALFDFDSRNPDELTFIAGDIIQKSEGVVPDPGWLAGYIGSRSGWFPESFVEVVTDGSVPAPVAEAAGLEERQNSVTSDYYVALYPYESTEADDLPFQAGEVILVTQSHGEWWSGTIGARSGIFPANYVARQSEVQSELEAETKTDYTTGAMTAFEREMGFEPSKTELEPYEEAELKREISEFTTKQAPSKSPKPVKTKKYELASVLSNYAGSEGQLNLVKGQLITVRKKSSSGWWQGEIQAKGKKREVGWFPGSYVKILGPAGGSRQSSSRTTPIHFEMEETMPVTVAPVYGDEGADESAKEQMVALYPYTAQNTDELTFVKDDIITVISKDEPDWWRGQIGSSVGLFPVNYVQPVGEQQESDLRLSSVENGSNREFQPIKPDVEEVEENDDDDDWDDGFTNTNTNTNEIQDNNNGFYAQQEQEFEPSVNYIHNPSLEIQRQSSIRELINTEENYMADMTVVKDCFIVPLYNSGLLTHDELQAIFVNWEDLIDCSNKLLKAFSVRKRTCGDTILMIGDILITHMPAMMTYIRFCSAQLRSAAIIQQKSEKSAEFREFTKKCQQKTQNLPLSSFLIKPMQRITKYPLLIKKVLEHTPDEHPDRLNLEEALSKAEELCAQVNEGVREKDNSDKMEWMQTHINCEGLEERVIFNSLTNAFGPRKFLHHGVLKKTKSGKELVGFLFNDFLLLAQPVKALNQTQFSFDRNKNIKFKIYRKPLFLNEITIGESQEPTAGEADFTITIGKVQINLTSPGLNEKRLWVKNVTEAKRKNQQFEQQQLQRQRSKKTSAAVGRLLVTVMEGNNLFDISKCVRRRRPVGTIRVIVVEGIRLSNRDPNGKSDPYCEVSLGSDVKRTSVLKQTLNPKWHDSMQFPVKDLHEDILCLTVYDKDLFSPDQFLGRMEIAIAAIYDETRNRKTPWTKTFHLHEIESGEITVKLHLHIFEK